MCRPSSVINYTYISAPPCRSCRIYAHVVSLLKILNKSDVVFELEGQYAVKGKPFALMHTIKAWPVDDVCSSMFPPATVSRSSLKVSDKYNRAVDNASVELRYNQGTVLWKYNWNNSEAECNYIPFTMKLSDNNVIP